MRIGTSMRDKTDVEFIARTFYPSWDAGDVSTLLNLRELLEIGGGVECKCFNKAEVDLIASQLTPEQRDRVKFSWLEFGTKP